MPFLPWMSCRDWCRESSRSCCLPKGPLPARTILSPDLGRSGCCWATCPSRGRTDPSPRICPSSGTSHIRTSSVEPGTCRSCPPCRDNGISQDVYCLDYPRVWNRPRSLRKVPWCSVRGRYKRIPFPRSRSCRPADVRLRSSRDPRCWIGTRTAFVWWIAENCIFHTM